MQTQINGRSRALHLTLFSNTLKTQIMAREQLFHLAGRVSRAWGSSNG